jgi:uncharacterized membrane protein
MSMGLEQQLEMREEHKKKMRSRQQGNRLGIFLVVLGLVLLLIGIQNERYYEEVMWVTVTKAIGGALLVFGYPLARLWFWFRAA